jgi:hypothetical protein
MSVILGLAAGAVTMQSNLTKSWPRDFAQVWFAARSILAGIDPYPLVGPHLALDWTWPLLYPLPAGVIAIPLASLSAAAASVVFSVIAGAAFAWALMEHGYAPLFGFFGASMHFAAETAQWCPLLSASLAVPMISLAFVAKPTISIALFAARPSRWAIVGGLVFGGIAFALQPHWFTQWLNAIARNNRAWAPTVPYRAPIMLPGGFLALACLARWRRPEARLVAVLACIPQTLMLYSTVALFLVPRTFKETASLVTISYVVFYAIEAHLPAQRTAPEYLAVSAPLTVIGMYLPVTLMILRRPNTGVLPVGLQQVITSWPEWLKGRS